MHTDNAYKYIQYTAVYTALYVGVNSKYDG